MTSATTGLTKVDVSFVEGLECQMHTTVKNVPFKKKIEMAVPKLSILAALKQTCSMKGKNMDSKEDRLHSLISFVNTWCLIFLCFYHINKTKNESKQIIQIMVT